MVLDIDTESKKHDEKKINTKIFFSKLTATLYLIILLPIVIALIGFLYLDQYKNTLISQELSGLRRQADTLAVMINKLEKDSASVIRRSLSMDSAMLLNPLAGRESEVRIRLFQPDGTLLADTSGLSQFAPNVEVFRLPKFDEELNTWIFSLPVVVTVPPVAATYVGADGFTFASFSNANQPFVASM